METDHTTHYVMLRGSQSLGEPASLTPKSPVRSERIAHRIAFFSSSSRPQRRGKSVLTCGATQLSASELHRQLRRLHLDQSLLGGLVTTSVHKLPRQSLHKRSSNPRGCATATTPGVRDQLVRWNACTISVCRPLPPCHPRHLLSLTGPPALYEKNPKNSHVSSS